MTGRPLRNAAAARAQLAAGRPALVWREAVADMLTPVGAAATLIEPGRGDFLLESVEGGEVRGRYSLLGLAPDLVFSAGAAGPAINRRWSDSAARAEAFEPQSGDATHVLRALVEECRIETPGGLPPALAVLVGFFGYETISRIEPVGVAEGKGIGLPDMVFVRPTVLLVFDSLSDAMFAVAPVWEAGGNPARAVDAAGERLDEVLRRLQQPPAPDRPEANAVADLPEPELAPEVPEGDYAAMVHRAKDYIAAGDVFQVVLAQRFTCPFTLPPLALYRALRRINPSPFLYFLDMPGFAIVGSSPEILVRVRPEGDGALQVTVRPIAGTRPRGADRAADRAAQDSLLADPKERAEHLMLLDLGRNDVGRVARAGSVEVTDSFTVERYSHVMHIVSNVVGELAEGRAPLDALFAGFPAGTVSGAPKVRACQVIAELEPERRGAYAGGVGYFAPDGSLDSCIVLRTAVVKDETMHVQAGAGIVADSDADYEARECRAKAGALLAAAREAVRIAGEAGYGQ